MTSTEAIEFALYLRCMESEDELVEDFSDEKLRKFAEHWRKYFSPGSIGEHSGDCTKHPWACLRCETEGRKKLADRILAALVEP